jgi:hypothetical protein
MEMMKKQNRELKKQILKMRQFENERLKHFSN